MPVAAPNANGVATPSNPTPSPGSSTLTPSQQALQNASIAANPQASYGGYGVAGNGITGTPIAGTTPMPPSPGTAAPGWTSDPIYQLVLGQQNLAISQAQSAALTAKVQALIAYGDPTLALAVTGDQNVAAAAAANKGSTLAQLVATNAQNVRDTNETENQSNLFYSSDRGYKLGLAQQAYLTNTSNALSSLQGNLGNIASNLLAQEQSAYANEQSAANDAYNRAIANPVGSPSSTSTPPPSNPPPPKTTTGGGAVPPVANGSTAPRTATAPYTVAVTANKTGGSANQKQGIFATH